MSAQQNDLAAIKQTLKSLQTLIDVLPCHLAGISEEAAGRKPSPDTWSKKEELGHLIDSASNNHQRIVRAQMESLLALPGYDGEQWVILHGYHKQGWIDLISLWREFNRQLLQAATSVPDTAWANTLTVGDSEPMTLGFVTVDYVKHMAHHLGHIGVDVDRALETISASGNLYPEKPAPVQVPINNLIARRWSPRAMDPARPVEREKTVKLLEAARWAPSCFNDQPRHFIVFDGSDKEALEKARACLVPGNAWATKAPMLLLSIARETFEYDGKPNRWAQHDVGLATENLLLQAVELGLVAHPMAGFDVEQSRKEFSIPEGFTPMAMIAIGYPYFGSLDEFDEKVRKGDLAERTRKSIEELAFESKFGSGYE
jgi:nitroreductase